MARSNVTNLTLPDGALFNYTWNVARRLTSITNNSGQKIEYTYNLNGDMTSSVTKSAALSIVRQMTMAYDELIK